MECDRTDRRPALHHRPHGCELGKAQQWDIEEREGNGRLLSRSRMSFADRCLCWSAVAGQACIGSGEVVGQSDFDTPTLIPINAQVPLSPSVQ
jgi:hypothetical protein